jgi:hypothetical protein
MLIRENEHFLLLIGEREACESWTRSLGRYAQLNKLHYELALEDGCA